MQFCINILYFEFPPSVVYLLLTFNFSLFNIVIPIDQNTTRNDRKKSFAPINPKIQTPILTIALHPRGQDAFLLAEAEKP